MTGIERGFEHLRATAPVFAALGDPVRLSIVRRLCEGGPLPTVQLKQGDVSRQGIAKHLRVLEDAGLLESSRVGRDRQWRLRATQFAELRRCLEGISAQWDERLERLRSLVEGGGP